MLERLYEMRRKNFSWLKDIVLTVITAIASVQIFVAISVSGCNRWNVSWLPIQLGMLVLGIAWDVMFLMANFPKRG